ncbi:uncharacterized protein LOC122966053 isoform X3 [Thunnus albacares]|uniref:uncharacterized protein LOC122966053 isoform X3 n=1 Tax=Thunnus albacares TaxID=8236 RepID=UPI001CF6EB22|nr:uncharacterized protein LOC122966053 isoform X3 [Thunnus albacares]
MKVVAVLALLVVNLCLSRCCYGEGPILLCLQIPQAFSPGYSTLVMILKDVGEINSTALRSDDLTSVTRLKIADARVTGVAARAFSSFQNLTSLHLEQNLLTEISPSWFSRPAVLHELNLTQNLIEVLNESMLNGFTGLSRLSLNKNRIRTIDPNSFNLLTNLAELDLSDNRMTKVSPQVFRSLNSTRMRLDENPWDCSCEAEEFVDFLKDLGSRSLLEEEMKVTCESPPSLKGRPVWNVLVCVTSPPPGPSAATSMTSPSSPSSSVTETSIHPKSSDLPVPDPAATGITETRVTFPPRPPSDPNIVGTFIAVIVVLCVLLFVVCILAVLYRRKRNSKAVMPGPQKEDGRLSRASPGLSEKRNFTGNKHEDSETGWRRPFTGVRAKSANALLFTSPFCVFGKDQATLQTAIETSSKDTEIPSEGKQTAGSESEAAGGVEAENITDSTDEMKKNKKQALDEDTHCVSVNTETVPYLSIGTDQNKPDDFNKQSADSQGQRSQAGKSMVRISTWPPTAVQWQERCKMKEEEEEEERAGECFKFQSEEKKVQSKENPSFFDKRGVKAEQTEELTALTRDPVLSKVSEFLKPSDKTSESASDHVNNCCSHLSDAHNQTDLRQEEGVQDSAAAPETSKLQKPNLEQLKPAEKLPRKISSKSCDKGELRNEPKRQRAETRSRSSKAPSDGASPDDETLLDGNEYAFMDLLHEVVQNNGRWTRERWKQVNKQRLNQQGQ